MEPIRLIIASVVIAGAVYFLIKQVDVRLVLFTAGLMLAATALKPWVVLDTFRIEMGNVNFIAPICSAMAYAFVLRSTGSDREMVRLLIAPIRRVRWLLVPGGCVVGFVTNMAITSNTAAASALAPILVPLMLASGFRPAIVGATLVIGCSAGGSLFNPGEFDVVVIQETTQAPLTSVLQAMMFPLLSGFAAVVAVFAFHCGREPVQTPPDAIMSGLDSGEPINYHKALLPPLPVVMILLLLPGWNLFPALLKKYPSGLPVSHAMLVSTMVALLVYRKEISSQARAFFEGMGYGYVNVISLIVTAGCFIEGMKAVGLTEKLVGLISKNGFVGKLASAVFPWLLAILSGTGTGPTAGFAKAVLPGLSESDRMGAVDLGVLATIAANFGRSMSPVAAVVIFSASLVNVSPLEVVKRTMLPLLMGGLVVFLLMLSR